MIAKIISHADTRAEAIDDLQAALNQSVVSPVHSNKGFLFECLDHPNFRAAQLDTGLIERAGQTLIPSTNPPQSSVDEAARRLRADILDWENLSEFGQEGSLRRGLFGFRFNAAPKLAIDLWCEGIACAGRSDAPSGLPSFSSSGGLVIVTERGQDRTFYAAPPRFTGSHSAHDGDIISPMPGRVIAVDVAEGQQVEAGQRLMVLEAMKMEHALTAPFAGVVAELAAVVGGQVQVDALLARVVASSPEPQNGSS